MSDLIDPLAVDSTSPPSRNLIRLLRRRGWIIASFLVITMTIVVVATRMLQPIYRATATVLIDMETPNVLGISTTRDEFTLGQSSYMTYSDYYRTQLEIITTHALAEQVFNNLKLGSQPRYTGVKDPVGVLVSQVTVEPVKATRLAKIDVDDPSPEQAARLANEFAVVLTEENLAKTMATEALGLMKNEYLKLQAKEAELSRRYKDKHPLMIRVHQEMQELAKPIEQEMMRQLQVQSEEAASKSIVDRMKTSSGVGSWRPNNIRVQDLAQIPDSPISPKPRLNIALGLLFGLLGGFGLAMLIEAWDHSVKVPEDIERERGLVLIGSIPFMGGLRLRIRRLLGRLDRIVHLEPQSPVAEAYRALRTRLLYAAAKGATRMMVLTSAGAQEGKTTTVSNLGIVLAQGGLNVLIVDADLRRGRLGQGFQAKRTPGLSEFLSEQASFEQIVQPTGIPGLSIVVSGARVPNPAEIVGSRRMQEFLERASNTFDRVLVDSPPVMAVTDAVVIAASVGTAIVVARSGRTPKAAVRQVVATCQGVQAQVLGVILNGVPKLDISPYYRYATYQYAANRDNQGVGHRPTPTATVVKGDPSIRGRVS